MEKHHIIKRVVIPYIFYFLVLAILASIVMIVGLPASFTALEVFKSIENHIVGGMAAFVTGMGIILFMVGIAYVSEKSGLP